MSFEHDVHTRAMEKIAFLEGLGDMAGNAWDTISGNLGTLSRPLSAIGGAGLGAMAGAGLGTPGMLAGGIAGGLGGYSIANALNQQSAQQNMVDAAMLEGMGAGLQQNDMTDGAQNQAINSIIDYLVSSAPPQQPDMGMGMGMGGMMQDPMMAGGMPPMPPGGMMQDPMMAGAPMPPMPPAGGGNPGLNGMAGAKKASMSIDAMAQMIAKKIVAAE